MTKPSEVQFHMMRRDQPIPFFRRRVFKQAGGGEQVYYLGGYLTQLGQWAVVWSESEGVVYRGQLVEGHPLAYPVQPTKEELHGSD